MELPSLSTPRKGGLKRDLLVLAALLAFCLPSTLMKIGASDSTNTMENIAVLSAQETWMRQEAGDTKAWIMPTVNGRQRVNKPPMLVWLDMAAWKGMTLDDGIEELIWRARLVSVGTGLVMLASIYWIGVTLGDRRYAVIATLVAGSMWFVQRQCRYASYDIQVTAWCTLSIAGALWAMRPFGGPTSFVAPKKSEPEKMTFAEASASFVPPSRSRWWGGWLVCGIAMAAAVMTKGPLALVLVLLPAAAIIVTLGKHGLRNRLLGLLLGTIVCVLLIAPWYLYAFQTVSYAWNRWSQETKAARDKFQVVYYYVFLFFLVTPWTIWLASGLIHPFTKGDAVTRRRRMIALVWFAAIFIFFSIPAAKQQRYILPIIPAVALLVAQVFRDHEALAEAGTPDKGVKWLRAPHWVALIVVSLLILPILGDYQMASEFIGRLDPDFADPSRAFASSIGWPAAIAVSAALLFLAIAGWRWHAMHKYTGAACTTAAWALLLTCVFWHAYELTPKRIHPLREPAEKVAKEIGKAKLRWLMKDPSKNNPNEEFLLYGRFTVPAITPEDVAKPGPAGVTQFVMTVAVQTDPEKTLGENSAESKRAAAAAAEQAAFEKTLEENSYQRLFEFKSDKDLNHWLWKRVN